MTECLVSRDRQSQTVTKDMQLVLRAPDLSFIHHLPACNKYRKSTFLLLLPLASKDQNAQIFPESLADLQSQLVEKLNLRVVFLFLGFLSLPNICGSEY